MQLQVVLPSRVEHVSGTVNGLTTPFEWDTATGSWTACVDQSGDDLYRLDIEMLDGAGNRSRYTDTVHYVLPGFVTDRSQKDIERRTNKAFLNASDLSRIEKNVELISGYIGAAVPAGREWAAGSLPRVSDMRRIRDSVERIRTGYAVRADTPLTPEQPLNTWQKWNAIEQILHDAYWMYMDNVNNVDYCGEISAGEGMGIL